LLVRSVNCIVIRLNPMAPWHYSVKLLPRIGVLRIQGDIPSSIPVGRVTPETLGNVDSVPSSPNYWSEIPPATLSSLVTQLSSWIEESESWSPNARMFGSDLNDQMQIWTTDNGELDWIRIDFSLSNPNPNNLNRLLKIPELSKCLFHAIQSEAVYPPTLSEWSAEMGSCSAVRYLRGLEYFSPDRNGG